MLAATWPLPALLAWAAGWLVHGLAQQAGAGARVALVAGALAGALAGVLLVGGDRTRRLIAVLGFPLSALLLRPGLDPLAWLVPALLLALVYPRRAWRDAPLFPTPRAALDGLCDALATLGAAPPRRVLDAGCGLGHGLVALRRQWPEAELHGIEWSRPVAALARWRARRAGLRATVTRGDLWAGSWAGFDLVYCFQRPESMARAWAKARAEMAPGAWLASLAFEVPGVAPTRVLGAPDGRFTLRLYRIGPASSAAARAPAATPGAGSSADPRHSIVPAAGR